ncbi:putative endonuclease involved in recombination [Candidatus Blochmanniella floridana]|uniref:Putative pre-16S rRNA nuclease n=1 Tax=Blochmanniella floridana TaxID=203907 RepID=YQGF_BLOFL|nr:RecName: Full=Putative pre-16S rRNA nuclease [Candidatus Blochmannia floridanus]CAD83321.1 putative endonuclease involved in recombination [Candidatus Blochmannia floridanus]
MIKKIAIIMAFDFGTKKIGIAIGQKITGTTQSLEILPSKFGIPNWKKIEHIFNVWKPNKLIVGLPLKMNGNTQHITLLSKRFAVQLTHRFKITVEMHDERFTTIEARSIYFQHFRYYYRKKTTPIDSIAAEIILKSWLNQND